MNCTENLALGLLVGACIGFIIGAMLAGLLKNDRRIENDSE
jgi:uncharacterized membrane-anchored protein YhcB (DUF1043 family)